MGYLLPTDYENFGLAPDTSDDWITVASSLMETYCRRISLNVTQYTERVRLTAGAQTALMTYLPLVAVAPATTPLVTVEARYTKPRRGEYQGLVQEEIWWAFSLPGMWTTLDPTTVDWTENGDLTFPWSVLGLPYNEVSVTYTAGHGSRADWGRRAWIRVYATQVNTDRELQTQFYERRRVLRRSY